MKYLLCEIIVLKQIGSSKLKISREIFHTHNPNSVYKHYLNFWPPSIYTDTHDEAENEGRAIVPRQKAQTSAFLQR